MEVNKNSTIEAQLFARGTNGKPFLDPLSREKGKNSAKFRMTLICSTPSPGAMGPLKIDIRPTKIRDSSSSDYIPAESLKKVVKRVDKNNFA